MSLVSWTLVSLPLYGDTEIKNQLLPSLITVRDPFKLPLLFAKNMVADVEPLIVWLLYPSSCTLFEKLPPSFVTVIICPGLWYWGRVTVRVEVGLNL